METTEQILERQFVNFEFRGGKVRYFSLSTQHGIADTIQEAIDRIIEFDKKYKGKSPLAYSISEYENNMEEIVCPFSVDDITEEDVDVFIERMEEVVENELKGIGSRGQSRGN